MDQDKKGLNKGQQKKLLKLFLKTVGITLAVCLVVIGGVVGTYYGFLYDGATASSNEVLTEEEQAVEDAKQERSVINQTVAVFGVDEDGTRTDVIFVVNFNSKTNKVKVVALPRDTKVNWSERQRRKYNEYTGYNIYTSKLNEMSAYGRMENLRDFTIDEIENILGVKIDNYVVINLEAFRKIVDSIDGVEVDVPRNMYYQDRSQGLYINLKKGVQHLDGDTAEQMVRYRQYTNGDVDRIGMQQIFLKAFASKIMSPETFNKLPSLIPTLLTYVKTDVKPLEIPSYYPFLEAFDMENLEFHTVPGEGRYENGISYYFIDQTELETLIEDVFFDNTVAEEEANPAEATTDEVAIDKSVSIEVYNGTTTKGLAGRMKDQLEKEGYTVERIENHEQTNFTTSIIYAKDIKKAEQFKAYLPGATIEVNSSIAYDIQMILGTDYIN